MVKNLPAKKKKKKSLPADAGDAGDSGSIPGRKDPLEQKMETHSSILAWKIPMDREPGELHPIGS